MRLWCLLMVTALAMGCSSDGHKTESVRKYCALTEMSFQNAKQMRAIHDRGVTLFEERKPYKKTAANRRVIKAATALVTTSNLAALQIENPKLFTGQPKGLNLSLVMAELIVACRELPKDKK